MIGINKWGKGENDNSVFTPAVEERREQFVTVTIPSITITLKPEFLFRIFTLLLYKFSHGITI